MNKLVPFFLLFIIFIISSFKPSDQSVPNSQLIKKIFVRDLRTFISASDRLYLDAKAYIADSCKKEKLIDDFKSARLAYKEIEYIVEYYAPATSKLINGPFLEKANEEEPSKPPVKPEGFQAIEDQLFASDTIDRFELETLCQRLKYNADRLFPMVASYTFTDQNLWWASRLELICIMSMGVTGFDSPSAKLSISEAKSSLNGIKKCWEVYVKNTEKEKPKQQWSEVIKLFELANQYVSKSRSFDSFDRLGFIVNCLNPLYAKGTILQDVLGIGYLDESTPIKQDALTVFASKSWNPDFFTSDKFQKNPAREKRAALGKLLFFDPILSSNGKRSCASCHNPKNGFAEDRAKSLAMDGKNSIKRNAPTLLNAALQASLFADGRLFFLEDQVKDVVFAPDELHGNFDQIAQKLRLSEGYRELFAEAFAGNADSEITSYAIIKSIAEYERTLLSFNSRFDQYMNGNTRVLSSNEIRGFNIFTGKALCASCHFMPLFNGTVPPMFEEGELEVLGVPKDPYAKKLEAETDLGRGDVTFIPWQNGSFKTPTVRNIELTAPYMHNGAYKTLEDVVDFYNKGGGRGLGLNVPNQTLPFDKLNLTKQEQKDLVAFMKTLTDTTRLVSIPRYLPEIEGFSRKIGGDY